MLNTSLYFIAILSLSSAANLVKLSQAPPDVIGFWRLLVAALILFPVAWFRGDLKSLHKDLTGAKTTALSGGFLYLHLFTYFYAAQNTAIANCMILFATNPLFATAGAYLFFKEKFTARLGIAYVLAFGGVFYLVSQNLKLDPAHFRGDISALFSAVFYSIYVLFGKKARQSVSNFSYSVVIYFIAAILFGLAGVSKGVNMVDWPLRSWLGIAGTIILPTFLGHFLFGYLLKHMNVNLMTCGKLMEPILSSILAYFIFSEAIKPQAIVAFAFTSTAVLILFFPWEFLQKKFLNFRS